MKSHGKLPVCMSCGTTRIPGAMCDNCFGDKKNIEPPKPSLANEDIKKALIQINRLKIEEGELLVVMVETNLYMQYGPMISEQIQNVMEYMQKDKVGILVLPEDDTYKFITHQNVKDFLKKYGFEHTKKKANKKKTKKKKVWAK